MAWKKGQFDVVKVMVTNQFKAFSINFNANMLMDRLILIWKIGKMHVRLLDTLEYSWMYKPFIVDTQMRIHL